MKRKLKIINKEKSYSLSHSCLFRIHSKKKLAQLLHTEISTSKKLTDDSNYSCFIDNSGSKPREIEHPNFALDQIHTRVASLICRIKQPDYIHSGVKGRSHITNAAEHIGHHKVLTSDIQRFYPSTNRKKVFDFFHKELECSTDIADLLSKICTCKDHIPTGSRISMPLAFWANAPMFNLLNKVSTKKSITFTVFVDDIVFSGNSIDANFIYKITKLISSFGHTIHPKKTKLYKPGSVKVITGVAVGSHDLLVANRHRKKIFQDISLWKAIEQQYRPLNDRLIGRMNAQSLIDHRFRDRVRTLKQSIKEKNKITQG